MTPVLTSRFMQYDLTQEEMVTALQLSPETRAHIQNLRAAAADELINNAVNPIVGTEYDRVLQARLRGEIIAYDVILSGTN